MTGTRMLFAATCAGLSAVAGYGAHDGVGAAWAGLGLSVKR